MTRTTLSQALAQRNCTDWSAQHGAPERAALASLVRTAFVDTIACILAGRGEEATRVVSQWVRTRVTAHGSASLLFGPERADSASAAHPH